MESETCWFPAPEAPLVEGETAGGTAGTQDEPGVGKIQRGTRTDGDGPAVCIGPLVGREGDGPCRQGGAAGGGAVGIADGQFMAAGSGRGDRAGAGDGDVLARDQNAVRIVAGGDDVAAVRDAAAVAADGNPVGVVARCREGAGVGDAAVVAGKGDGGCFCSRCGNQAAVGDGDVVVVAQYGVAVILCGGDGAGVGKCRTGFEHDTGAVGAGDVECSVLVDGGLRAGFDRGAVHAGDGDGAGVGEGGAGTENFRAFAGSAADVDLSGVGDGAAGAVDDDAGVVPLLAA